MTERRRRLSPGWTYRPGYYLSTAPQGSPDWLRARVGRITASSAAAAAGNGDYPPTANKQSYELLARRLCGLEPPLRRTDDMEWGSKMEPSVRRWFQHVYMRERLGRVVDIREVGLAVPEHHQWLGASLDGEIFDSDGLGNFDAVATEMLEIKAPRRLKPILLERGKPGYDLALKTLPRDHYYQMQLCMYVTRKQACWYVVWPRHVTDGVYYHIERVPFDREWTEDVINGPLRQFYDDYIGPLQLADPLLLPLLPVLKEEEKEA